MTRYSALSGGAKAKNTLHETNTLSRDQSHVELFKTESYNETVCSSPRRCCYQRAGRCLSFREHGGGLDLDNILKVIF